MEWTKSFVSFRGSRITQYVRHEIVLVPGLFIVFWYLDRQRVGIKKDCAAKAVKLVLRLCCQDAAGAHVGLRDTRIQVQSVQVPSLVVTR